MAPVTNLFGGNYGKDQQKKAWGDLGSLFGKVTEESGKLSDAGHAASDAAAGYFQKLLSGNRQETEAAAAPAANDATSAADASKKEQATMGTARTGGGVAANQQVDDKVRSQVDTLISGAKPAAATTLGNIGANDLSQMINSLSVGSSAASNLAEQTGVQQRYSNEQATKGWGGIADIAMAILTGGVK